MKTISPVAIDLGAKYSGVYLSHFADADGPSGADKECVLLEVSKNNLDFMLKNRTAKRHQRRGYQRRKLAKRLFRAILRDAYGVGVNDLSRKKREWLNGLFNRRGFTFLTEDNEERAEKLSNAPLQWISDHLDVFHTDADIETQLQVLSSDPDQCSRLLDLPFFSTNREEQKRLLQTCDPALKKEAKDAVKALRDSLRAVVRSEKEGHKPRKQYLEEVAADIRQCKWLKDDVLKPSGISADEFAMLVGHISNMQLRVLRRYFADPSMAKGGHWDEARMRDKYARYIKAWHCKRPEERESKTALLEQLATGDSLLKIWTSTRAELSIPPYEDMNNRRPVKCRSLLLNEDELNRLFPDWKKAAEKIEAIDDPGVLAGKSARILQAFLDRSKADDEYELRAGSMAEEGSAKHDHTLARLSESFGVEIAKGIIKIAGLYYSECSDAAAGNWNEKNKGNLLRLCNTNPPRRHKVAAQHFSAVLGAAVKQEQLDELRSKWREIKFGARTLRGAMELAAKLQKDHGGAFKQALKVAEDPDIKKLIPLLENIGDALADFFPAGRKELLADPFIIAQMFNMLEGDQHGFSKTCRECSEDNAWRMEKPEGALGARARRLPADSVRPFDGMLARITDRLARDIARRKIEQMKNAGAGEELFIPVVIEQNSFLYERNLQDLRKEMGGMRNVKKQKNMEKAADRQVEAWQSKRERIVGASFNVCPYTGEDIGSRGQIDHIVSRAYTRHAGRGIFNAEPNLIYCTTVGNTQKNDAVYSLEQLHLKYLQAVFQSTDRNAIEQQIVEGWGRLKQNPKAITRFYALPEEDRRIIRHGLFVPAIRDEIIRELDMQNRVRVNGTQRWLCKCLATHLQDLVSRQFPDTSLTVRMFIVEAEAVHAMRQMLALTDADFAKPERQPAFSHCIDAALSWNALLAEQTLKPYLSVHPEDKAIMDQCWIDNLLPEAMDVERVQRKPLWRKQQPQHTQLFKDGILGEHFLPTLIMPDGSIKLGFDAVNSIEIPEKLQEQWVECLRPFWNSESLDVEAALENWKTEAQKRKSMLSLRIDKNRACEHLHRIAKEPAVEKALLQANCLEGISYLTGKVNVFTKGIVDAQKKIFRSEKAIFHKNFDINVEVKFGRGKAVKGTLELPAKNVWKSIVQHPDIKPRLDTKLEDFDLDAFIQKLQQEDAHIFQQTCEPDGTRRKARKVFSLPQIPSSGSLARIRRYTDEGEPVWQIQCLEAKACGITPANEHVLLPYLTKSPNLHVRGYRYQEEPGQVALMDHWLELDVPEELNGKVLGIAHAPGQASNRSATRLRMKERVFMELIAPNLKLVEEAPVPTRSKELNIEYSLESAGLKAFQEAFDSICGKPRKIIRLLQIGPEIEFQYKNQSPGSLDRMYMAQFEKSVNR